MATLPITTIEPTDSWWDDPVRPLVRNELSVTLMYVYDVYMRDPKPSYTDTLIYSVHKNDMSTNINYTIIGSGEPVFIHIDNIWNTTAGIRHINCVIDCISRTYGAIAQHYTNILLNAHAHYYSQIVETEMRNELVRRNRALVDMPDDDIKHYCDRSACCGSIRNYIASVRAV